MGVYLAGYIPLAGRPHARPVVEEHPSERFPAVIDRASLTTELKRLVLRVEGDLRTRAGAVPEIDLVVWEYPGSAEVRVR